MRCRKIVLGIIGALAIAGLCYLHEVTTPSKDVSAEVLRTGKAAGHTREQAMYRALRDTLNVDGSYNNIDINSGAIDGATVGATSASSGAFTTLLGNYLSVGTETVTTSSADPGIGTASASVSFTAVVTDNTGSATDTVSLLDGTVAGEIHIFSLKTDNETTGMAIVPVNFAGGTSTNFHDVGDGAAYIWDGTNWVMFSNNGGEVQ